MLPITGRPRLVAILLVVWIPLAPAIAQTADQLPFDDLRELLNQAVATQNTARLAGCFYAKGDQANRIGTANAQRLIAGHELESLAKSLIGDRALGLAYRFGILTSDDEIIAQSIEVHGDTAAAGAGLGEQHTAWCDGGLPTRA